MTQTATLMIAAPEADANLYYACHFLAPDPILYFEVAGRKTLLLSDLEIDRAKQEASVHSIISTSQLFAEMRKQKKRRNLQPNIALIDYVFSERKIRSLIVPSNFPSQYYAALKKAGYQITIKPDPFIEARVYKTDQEKRAVTQALAKVGRALHEALLVLEKSKIKKSRVYYGKEVVTSELLRSIINTSLMRMGCIGSGTIVASGVQASFPHHHGSGPIIPHTPIIFDIFPRDTTSHYFADMTRTVVKGRPSDTVKKMYRAVKEANQCAAEQVRDGVCGSKVHGAAVQTLEKYGFKTGRINGRMQGFIHSTGHGLGLDIHELPSVSLRKDAIKKRQVITIEPGLYYEEHGGIRLEDVLFVTKTGSELLTRIPKIFEIDR